MRALGRSDSCQGRSGFKCTAYLPGSECGQWAQGAFDLRGAQALRSIMGLCGLIKNHSASAINGACAKALKAGTYRFKDLRRLIGEQSEQKLFAFADNHPLIRDLTVYSNFINQISESYE